MLILTAVIGMSARSVEVVTIESLLVQPAKGGAAVARTMTASKQCELGLIIFFSVVLFAIGVVQ